MPFPESITELRDAGYVGPTGKSTCKCGAALEWWTTPKGKKMPMDAGTARPHFARCPLAGKFRKRAKPARCDSLRVFTGRQVRCALPEGHSANHRDERGNAWATP